MSQNAVKGCMNLHLRVQRYLYIAEYIEVRLCVCFVSSGLTRQAIKIWISWFAIGLYWQFFNHYLKSVPLVGLLFYCGEIHSHRKIISSTFKWESLVTRIILTGRFSWDIPSDHVQMYASSWSRIVFTVQCLVHGTQLSSCSTLWLAKSVFNKLLTFMVSSLSSDDINQLAIVAAFSSR